MFLKKELYLIESKKYVTLEIYIPFDTQSKLDILYLLDGQNAFKDKNATFGRSLRMKKHLDFAYEEMNKNILGVSIYSPSNEIDRTNEYAPFTVTYSYIDSLKKNKTSKFKNFIKDFSNIIIPYIENNFNVNKGIEHRFLYGSSLAATTALFLAFKNDRLFNIVGCFSTALFLYHDEFYQFLDKRKNKDAKIFLYVGKNEISDSINDTTLYLKTSLELYNYLKEKGNNVKLLISKTGKHNEKSWDVVFDDFISYIYEDKITYRL